jgi:hypothetical protein
VKRAMIPADPLERFVLERVEQIVCSLPTLHDDIVAELVRQQAEREKQKGQPARAEEAARPRREGHRGAEPDAVPRGRHRTHRGGA